MGNYWSSLKTRRRFPEGHHADNERPPSKRKRRNKETPVSSAGRLNTALWPFMRAVNPLMAFLTLAPEMCMTLLKAPSSA